MHEETQEEYQLWRRECHLASRAGFKLHRQQPKNRYTDVDQYLEQLQSMVLNTRDPVLQQRYMNFLSTGIAYWQKRQDNQPSKAAYEHC